MAERERAPGWKFWRVLVKLSNFPPDEKRRIENMYEKRGSFTNTVRPILDRFVLEEEKKND